MVPCPKKLLSAEKEIKPKRIPVVHRTRNITGFTESVHQWPKYPGGADVFMKFLDQVGKEMVEFLPTGTRKAFVQVEFIVDRDGTPTNFKVLRGSNDDDFNDELIKRLENMGTWEPALLYDKPVPKKMIQTVTVEATQ